MEHSLGRAKDVLRTVPTVKACENDPRGNITGNPRRYRLSKTIYARRAPQPVKMFFVDLLPSRHSVSSHTAREWHVWRSTLALRDAVRMGPTLSVRGADKEK